MSERRLKIEIDFAVAVESQKLGHHSFAEQNREFGTDAMRRTGGAKNAAHALDDDDVRADVVGRIFH